MLPNDKTVTSVDIYAAQKIIADISSGLYRSPAAALKELVSNAYDADAEHVVIETDPPQFRTLVIRDDGSGMTIDRFLHVMTHIGGSTKRILGGEQTPGKQRQIIGRIGIGLLAVAQLSFRFYVTSSVRESETRFIAEVDLSPYHKDDAALMSMKRMTEGKDEVLIGAIRYVDSIPEQSDAHYTAITIPDAKESLITEITNAVREAVGATELLSVKTERIDNFEELIEVSRGVKRADTSLDGYYYMLWELGLICPVNYVRSTPFNAEGRVIEGAQVMSFQQVPDFDVTIDGVSLKRPQSFPSTSAARYPGPDPIAYPLEFERDVSNRKLKFTGYVYAQQPRIDPEELRGVHVRIRNVGIGLYDRTWLGYPFDEGIKFGQLSGEIYVHDGLESALNIDRDSFRETDVHFQALRAYLWDKLRNQVFPEFKSRQKEHTKLRKAVQASELQSKFAETLDDLPSQVQNKVEVTSIGVPTFSTWIEHDDTELRFEKGVWRSFIGEHGLLGTDAQERFVRVLRVLLSSEITRDLTDEEANALLAALAVAVQ